MGYARILTGSSYAKRLFGLLALAIAWLFTFPIIAFAVMNVTGCSRVGGACGAVGVIAGLTILPLGFLAIFILMALVVRRRLATLDAPGWWAFLVFMLFVGDLGKLAALGGGWAVAFALGVMGLIIPWRLIAGISTLTFLGRYPDGAFLTDPTPTKKTAYAAFLFLSLSTLAVIVLGVLLAVLGVTKAWAVLSALIQFRPLAIVAGLVLIACLLLEPVACITLIVCYKKILRQARDEPPPSDLGIAPPPAPPPSPYPSPYPYGTGQAVTFGRRAPR